MNTLYVATENSPIKVQQDGCTAYVHPETRVIMVKGDGFDNEFTPGIDGDLSTFDELVCTMYQPVPYKDGFYRCDKTDTWYQKHEDGTILCAPALRHTPETFFRDEVCELDMAQCRDHDYEYALDMEAFLARIPTFPTL